jgi:serine/threonine protein kinase
MSIAPGTVLGGKYRVDRVLGEGGMGVVAAATHVDLGSRVAVKFLLRHALENQDIVARFEREARSTASLQSDHVVNVTDVGRFDDGAPYMVMELLSGCDLASGLVRAGGKLPVAEAIAYASQACVGLGDAHDAGIVHRDVKPSNLFLHSRKDKRVVVKVVDFGIAKDIAATNTSLTQASSMMGSPKYMSPEQLRDSKSVDARSDVWSLGVVLFEMLAGRTPFEAESMAVLHADILGSRAPSLLDLRPEIPPALDAIVQRCLEKDPAARFGNMRELGAALAQIAMVTSAVEPSFVLTSERILKATDPTPATGFDATAIAEATPAHVTTGARGHGPTPVSLGSPTGASTVADGAPAAAGARTSRAVPMAIVAAAALVALAIGLKPASAPPAPPPAPAAAAPPAPEPAPALAPAPVAAPAPTAAVAAVAPPDDAGTAAKTAAPKAAAAPAAAAPTAPSLPVNSPKKRKSSLDMSFD